MQISKPHIIAICEVKRKQNGALTLLDYDIPGYTLHPLNLDNTTGRGIVIYTIQGLDKSVNQIVLNNNFEEACLLEIRLRGNDIMLFGCIYRSPTPSTTSKDNNASLNKLLLTISKSKYSHVCLVGDFNYKHINWKNLSTPKSDISDEHKFLESVKDSFLHQHVDTPTRRRRNDDPSLLDLVLTDESMQISQFEHLAPLGKSDHNMLSFEFDCYVDYKSQKDTFLYHKGDYEAIRKNLVESKWSELFASKNSDTSVEEMWKDIKFKLHELRDEFIPKVKIGNKPCWQDKGNIPIDIETREVIRKKNNAFRKWMSSLNTDKENNRLLYIKARNKCKRIIRRSKKKFEKNIADNSKLNPKAFWKHVRRKLKSKTGVAPLLQNALDKSSIKHSDQEKANILQQQFTSVYTKEPAGKTPTLRSRSEKCVESMLITEDMVLKELKSLDPNKSIGPDDIHPLLVKELATVISHPITLLFKKTLTTGCIPVDWKKAVVSPIYKKGPKNIAENYRPISLTSILCKIMEKFVRKEILTHLMDNSLLSDRQFGFINGRSTTTQLLFYLDYCVNLFADGGVIDTIYLDFSKPFDTVPHRRLLNKLKAYGINGELYNWIKDFLTSRSQIVKVNGTSSFQSDVISGVPHGSVLGPLLFVIYINDILDTINSEGLLYADDTKIFRQIASKDDAKVLAQDVKNLETWSNVWLLKFHPDKCHVLSIGRFENIMHTERYIICDKEIEHVFEEKDLGIIIDGDLTFSEHISAKARTANSIVGLIRRAFAYLDKKSFKKLYTAFVRPHLEYAQSVWSPYSKKYIDIIENVQKRATKLVDGMVNMTYQERLEEIKLPSLAYRRKRGDMIEMYKHINLYNKNIISPIFKIKSRPSRQHNHQVFIPKAKDGIHGVHTNAFYQRAIPVWNLLPKEVVDSTTLNSFKQNLDKVWLDRIYLER